MDSLLSFISPFNDYLFMRRSLVACIGISLASAPIGVILTQKKMSLMGEALSHGILPGIGIAFLLMGYWLPGLMMGGVIAGLLLVFLSHLTAKKTILTEDASFSSLYIVALAVGVLILSVNNGNMNLMHLLFGNALSVSKESLLLIALTTTVTLIIFMAIYRSLIFDCFDPLFMRSVNFKGSLLRGTFLVLIVCNLMSACQALGTLMALGIMMIPAITARLLSNELSKIFLISIFGAFFYCFSGLLISFYLNWPSGPTIIIVAGIFHIMVIGLNILKKPY